MMLSAENNVNLSEMKRRTTVMPGMYFSSSLMRKGRSPYETEPAMLPKMEKIRMNHKFAKIMDLEFIALTEIKKE